MTNYKRDLWKKYFNLVEKYDKLIKFAELINVTVEQNSRGIDFKYGSKENEIQAKKVISKSIRVFNELRIVMKKLTDDVNFKMN
jgi:hypothetical protein